MDTVFTTGKCLNMPLQIGELSVIVDAYILELGGVDVILRVAWLQSLGKIVLDYKEMSMSFTFQDQFVFLFGMGNKAPQSSIYDLHALSLQRVRKVSFREAKGWLWHTEISIYDSKLSSDQYRDLIVLKEETEIERQVNEMLQQGIIHHSSSPFSSPVILVKKKDNTRHMCVDYRALNKATIQDKFPIPVVDESLDELHGAYYFSKLDLKSGYHQICMREDDIAKSAFRTHEGRHYEYLVMPFGLMNAPATFQAAMNLYLSALLTQVCIGFFLVTS